jgi:hypothetical protein
LPVRDRSAYGRADRIALEDRSMAVSAFLDADRRPETDEVTAALGDRAGLWDAIVAFVEGPCGARTTWVHEGRTTGWALRCVRAGRPFVVLYPEAGAVAVRVVIGERDRDAALGLLLGDRIGAALRDAHRYPDGTWVYARPETPDDTADLCRLLTVKLPPTVRARIATHLSA